MFQPEEQGPPQKHLAISSAPDGLGLTLSTPRKGHVCSHIFVTNSSSILYTIKENPMISMHLNEYEIIFFIICNALQHKVQINRNNVLCGVIK